MAPAKRGKKLLLKVVDITGFRNSGSEPSGDESVDPPKPPRKKAIKWRGGGKKYEEETPEQADARRKLKRHNASVAFRNRQPSKKARAISDKKALYATLAELKKENENLLARSSTAAMLLKEVSTSDSGVDAGMSSSSLLQRKFPTTNPFYFLTVIAILIFVQESHLWSTPSSLSLPFLYFYKNPIYGRPHLCIFICRRSDRRQKQRSRRKLGSSTTRQIRHTSEVAR